MVRRLVDQGDALRALVRHERALTSRPHSMTDGIILCGRVEAATAQRCRTSHTRSERAEETDCRSKFRKQVAILRAFN